MAVTQKQIDKAVEECMWREEVGGVGICRDQVCPCVSIIESGQCSVLIELFRNEGSKE